MKYANSLRSRPAALRLPVARQVPGRSGNGLLLIAMHCELSRVGSGSAAANTAAAARVASDSGDSGHRGRQLLWYLQPKT